MHSKVAYVCLRSWNLSFFEEMTPRRTSFSLSLYQFDENPLGLWLSQLIYADNSWGCDVLGVGLLRYNSKLFFGVYLLFGLMLVVFSEEFRL